MLTLLEYLEASGGNPFAAWFDDLDAQAAAKVRAALLRLEAGNVSKVKGVGAGVLECKIDFGPGYRIYFGRDGEKVDHSSCRRHEGAAAKGYRRRRRAMGRLQTPQERK